MKKSLKLILVGALAASMTACSSTTTTTETAGDGIYTAGTYTGEADGFGGKVTVTIETDANAITSVEIVADDETPTVGGAALEELSTQVLDAQSAEIDGVSGATLTSGGVKEAAAAAIAQAKGEGAATEASGDLAFTAGTYTGKGTGYNGVLELNVTFTDSAIERIEVGSSAETAFVGDVSFPILTEDAIAANGSGVDSVGGATFSSRAFKEALNDAAEQAACTNMDAFKKNTVAHEAGEDIDETYDVVVVGAGGAGMAAAAQATQEGLSVLVIEENAEVGGNTLVSGGQFQAAMPYLVWDAKNPDATEAVWDYDGNTYEKVKSAHGNIDVLKTILNWSEEEFDADYYKDHEYVAGDIIELSKHGVHADYLPTLKALKAEIKEYLAWAQPKLDAGTDESEITLFSTNNLHIFQTYYGGLRVSADGSEWIYGDFDLVNQFISGGYDMKIWLEEQGGLFADGKQLTLIGALWYRENQNMGCDMDHDGTPEIVGGNWGTYFLPMKTTVLSSDDNKIMTRTTAENLIIEDGKVTGVTATMYDGTKVTAHANKGVVLSTGGYAANIDMVVENNTYWDPSFVTSSIKTTNRSSLQGDGIKMGEEAGADTTGLGFPQMMPISWIDNGNLSFGGGQYAVYINPTTGARFVDESAERDVLSLGEFKNGVDVNGTKGVFLEITNAKTAIGIPYPYDKYEKGAVSEISTDDVEGRVYFFSSQDELKEILDQYGMTADPADIYATIEAYDKAYIDGTDQPDGIIKSAATTTVGTYEDGEYKLDGELLRVRIMAPSTHHTMGGLVVDVDRHVLDADGNIIEGLYAAGEVTGGIHAGNRLGGNAIVEVIVSGRTAAKTIAAE
ncbi:MAG: FAD-dependent oxidoreductase [Erysipelotrichaceae bacterium]|nr:FAD-dependent oxidoreductase [Erysipelotrichaceae bacterium]